MVTASPVATSGGRNASAIPCPSIGEKLPLVTSPTVVAAARAPRSPRAGSGGRRCTRPRRRRAHAAVVLGLERGAAAEVALVEAHHPAEPGLQRRDPRAELVAVERQPGLEPQRVAGAEPGGRDPGVEQRAASTRGRGVGGHVELDAVLAGVAGAGDPARASPRERRPAPPRSAPPRRARARPPASSARASGPCTASTTRVAVTSSTVALAPAVEHRGLAERVDERRGVRRVGHHEEVARRDPPHDDVVDDVRVVGVEQVRVLRPPGRDAVEVVGERPLQRGERAGAVHAHRAEVRDVEHDRALAARAVLLEHAGVLDRHLPPAELGTMRAPSARCSASSGL